MILKKINGFFFSFLLGGAIGSVVALLYAPKQGKLLRNDISRKTNDLIEEGKKMTFDSWDKAKGKAESTIESANDFLNTGKEKIARKTEKIKDALKSQNKQSDSSIGNAEIIKYEENEKYREDN